MKDVYRTPTGILCGILYERPLPNHVESHDACMIQRALLNKSDRSFLAILKRVFL